MSSSWRTVYSLNVMKSNTWVDRVEPHSSTLRTAYSSRVYEHVHEINSNTQVQDSYLMWYVANLRSCLNDAPFGLRIVITKNIHCSSQDQDQICLHSLQIQDKTTRISISCMNSRYSHGLSRWYCKVRELSKRKARAKCITAYTHYKSIACSCTYLLVHFCRAQRRMRVRTLSRLMYKEEELRLLPQTRAVWLL